MEKLEAYQYILDHLDSIPSASLDGWLIWVDERSHPTTVQDAAGILQRHFVPFKPV
jgi:hypothetical protein